MRYLTLSAVVLLALVWAKPARAQKESEILKVQQVIATIVEKDPGMQKWFDDAHGYAVFPNVGKGAMGVGAAHGNGLVYESGELVGKSELLQVTVGLQLSGQSFVEVIFFKDETASKDFTRGPIGSFACKCKCCYPHRARGDVGDGSPQRGVIVV